MAFAFPQENCVLFFTGLFRSEFLSESVSVHGMLVGLLAEFVSRQVIFFAMGDRRDCMHVGRKIMEFRSSLVVSL